ncbi:unnamed protein product [Rangifer tarandus platyrhynchus]|uniref:RRM domain-containing protein n=1 Tax=Rangifer tarandus platyrhynchus TaxID=3082113 RepID=A0ABN8XIM8_RANTA|nr:unnamed protein product [Rangifer tarandus platyrhynchus]
MASAVGSLTITLASITSSSSSKARRSGQCRDQDTNSTGRSVNHFSWALCSSDPFSASSLPPSYHPLHRHLQRHHEQRYGVNHHHHRLQNEQQIHQQHPLQRVSYQQHVYAPQGLQQRYSLSVPQPPLILENQPPPPLLQTAHQQALHAAAANLPETAACATTSPVPSSAAVSFAAVLPAPACVCGSVRELPTDKACDKTQDGVHIHMLALVSVPAPCRFCFECHTGISVNECIRVSFLFPQQLIGPALMLLLLLQQFPCCYWISIFTGESKRDRTGAMQSSASCGHMHCNCRTLCLCGNIKPWASNYNVLNSNEWTSDTYHMGSMEVPYGVWPSSSHALLSLIVETCRIGPSSISDSRAAYQYLQPSHCWHLSQRTVRQALERLLGVKMPLDSSLCRNQGGDPPSANSRGPTPPSQQGLVEDLEHGDATPAILLASASAASASTSPADLSLTPRRSLSLQSEQQGSTSSGPVTARERAASTADRPDTVHGRSVYVANIVPGTSKEALKSAIDLVLENGCVLAVEMRERSNMQPYAFVELSTLQAAYELVQHKKTALVVLDQQLKVQFKKVGLTSSLSSSSLSIPSSSSSPSASLSLSPRSCCCCCCSRQSPSYIAPAGTCADHQALLPRTHGNVGADVGDRAPHSQSQPRHVMAASCSHTSHVCCRGTPAAPPRQAQAADVQHMRVVANGVPTTGGGKGGLTQCPTSAAELVAGKASSTCSSDSSAKSDGSACTSCCCRQMYCMTTGSPIAAAAAGRGSCCPCFVSSAVASTEVESMFLRLRPFIATGESVLDVCRAVSHKLAQDYGLPVPLQLQPHSAATASIGQSCSQNSESLVQAATSIQSHSSASMNSAAPPQLQPCQPFPVPKDNLSTCGTATEQGSSSNSSGTGTDHPSSPRLGGDIELRFAAQPQKQLAPSKEQHVNPPHPRQQDQAANSPSPPRVQMEEPGQQRRAAEGHRDQASQEQLCENAAHTPSQASDGLSVGRASCATKSDTLAALQVPIKCTRSPDGSGSYQLLPAEAGAHASAESDRAARQVESGAGNMSLAADARTLAVTTASGSASGKDAAGHAGATVAPEAASARAEPETPEPVAIATSGGPPATATEAAASSLPPAQPGVHSACDVQRGTVACRGRCSNADVARIFKEKTYCSGNPQLESNSALDRPSPCSRGSSSEEEERQQQQDLQKLLALRQGQQGGTSGQQLVVDSHQPLQPYPGGAQDVFRNS